MPPPAESSVLFLGTGYTGAVAASILRRAGAQVVTTSRQPGSRDAVLFDLHDPSTWNSLPSAAACVWLFPAEPASLVRQCARSIQSRYPSCVVIGTTSSYVVRKDGAEVDEMTPLDERAERVKGEEILRAGGAIVLRSAGIYGPRVSSLPRRNPLDWLRKGLVRDGKKFVNLIHVEDLAATIIAAVRSPLRGEDFVVSDGHPRRWNEILAWGNEHGYLHNATLPSGGGEGSKRLITGKLERLLTPPLSHTDLWTELEILEKGS